MKKSLDRVMRKPEVLNLIGLSDPTIWRMERLNKFPKRIKIGPGSVGWFENEIREWLDRKAAERGAKNAD